MLDIKIEKLQIDNNLSLSVYNDKISINIKGMNKLAFINYTDELFEIIKTARFRVLDTLEKIDKYDYPYSNKYKKKLHQIVFDYYFGEDFRKKDTSDYNLPNNLRGRSIHSKVIPTVCNLENMLDRLVEFHGDFSRLKQWEKRSYKAYRIEDIKSKLIYSLKSEWKQIIRKHILDGEPSDFGASCIDQSHMVKVNKIFLST